MQKWYEWLEEMKKKDEKRKDGGNASAQMIEGAERSAGLLHKISKVATWRGGAQIWENEEVAGSLRSKLAV